MELDKVYDIRKALTNAGILLKEDRSGFSKKDADKAKLVIGTLNADVDEYIAKEKELHEKSLEEAKKDMPANIPTCFSRMQFINPILDSVRAWGEGDNLWFGDRIRFARDQIDSVPMMFIKKTESKFAAIPLIKSRAIMRASISSVLSESLPNHANKYHNLYEELIDGIDEMFAWLIANYKSRNIKGSDELARHMIKYLPSSMIKSYPITMTVLNKTVNDNDIKIPEMAYFSKDGSKVDAVTHLVDNFDMLAGNKELFLKDIPKIYSNDVNVPALHHLDLDSIVEQGPHPTWDKYFARFRPEEAEVIRAFFWSIFDADNNSRQALYFEDIDGFSAKSVVMRVISHYLGEDLVAAIQKDSLSNQFGLAKLWDKRLVYIGDNKNPNLIRSEKMHMLLGGDLADIELKGQNSFTAKLNAKVIASGNITLDIDPHARHERTRIIVVKPHVPEDLLREFVLLDENGNIKRDREGEPQFIGDNTFEPRLMTEFKAMMWDARNDYKKLCPTGSSIILPDFMIDELYDMSSSSVDAADEIIERYFTIGDNEFCLPGELRRTFKMACTALDADIKFDDFTAHLYKKFSIKKKSSRKVNNTKVYAGIGIRAVPGSVEDLKNRPEYQDMKAVEIIPASKAGSMV